MSHDHHDHGHHGQAHDEHGHGGPGHGHDHGHGRHHHAPASFGRAFADGIALNTAYVAAEVAWGLMANSLALVADAGHNFGDVLSQAAIDFYGWPIDVLRTMRIGDINTLTDAEVRQTGGHSPQNGPSPSPQFMPDRFSRPGQAAPGPCLTPSPTCRRPAPAPRPGWRPGARH